MARRVMGWLGVHECNDPHTNDFTRYRGVWPDRPRAKMAMTIPGDDVYPVPRWSTEHGETWRIIERIEANGYGVVYEKIIPYYWDGIAYGKHSRALVVKEWPRDRNASTSLADSRADTFPLAACRVGLALAEAGIVLAVPQ